MIYERSCHSHAKQQGAVCHTCWRRLGGTGLMRCVSNRIFPFVHFFVVHYAHDILSHEVRPLVPPQIERCHRALMANDVNISGRVCVVLCRTTTLNVFSCHFWPFRSDLLIEHFQRSHVCIYTLFTCINVCACFGRTDRVYRARWEESVPRKRFGCRNHKENTIKHDGNK